jgi:Uma2 family endonuclease
MSETLVREKLLTAEEFYDQYSSLDVRADLVDGMVIEMPPAGPFHGRVDSSFIVRLKLFVVEHGLGEVFLNTGFILRRNPDLVRGPDEAFVSNAKIEAHPIPRRGFWHVVPDLVVEIVSPDDRAQDILDKVTDYLDAGVSLVWVLYPPRQQAYVHRPGQRPELLNADGVLDGEDVLPGFRLALADIWRE